MSAPVRITFLGGLGEIGRNCLCIEVRDRILIVDCGLMFPTEDMPGVDLVLPDLRYIYERANKLEAVVLTHGHEDHIGALPYLLKSVSVPIHGSPFALGMLEAKLAEAEVLRNAALIPFADGEEVQAGPFSIRTIPVAHSTPEAVGLAITTPQGVICHTGDFKLDHTPVDGRNIDLSTFGALGKSGVRLMLSDSTNAENAGVTGSESLVGEWLSDIFGRNENGRIVAACFASHLHRVQQITDAAIANGRKVAYLGRSMASNVELARDMGIIDVSASDIVDATQVGDTDPAEICIVCTGSQGEPYSALSLMAAGEHKWANVGEDDTVVISSSPIPGNEASVNRAIDGLIRSGADVVHAGVADVHVSGHAAAEELKVMASLVRPEYFVPIHGEYRHLTAHANLATSIGIPEENVLVAEDGDVIELTDDGLDFTEGEAPAGYVYVDGSGVGDVTGGVLRDRLALADDGVVICVIGVDSHNGEVVRGPEILSRGFLSSDDHEDFAAEAAELVVASIEDAAEEGALDLTTLNRHVRQTLGRFASQQTGRRPFVFPLVIEV